MRRASGRFHAAVIGAGLAGLVAARRLALGGLSVLLVDRQTEPGKSIATTGIFVRKTLEDFELPGACFGRWISDVTLWSPGGRALALRASQPEFRVARMPEVYRALADDCLRAGVVASFGTRYIGVTGSAPLGPSRPLQITLARGLREFTVEADVLIGADGALSAVARDLGLSRNTDLIVGLEDVGSSEARGDPAMHCMLDPRLAPGYVAWVVDDGEEVHAGTAGYARRFDPLAALANVRELARRRLGSPLAGAHRRGGLIPVGGILPRIACSRGLLVSDAAGVPSPLTAGGIDPCFRLSEFAADIVVRALRSGTLERVNEYRADLFAPRFFARRWLRRLLAAVDSPFVAETAFALLASPLAAPLARRIFFERGSFPQPPILKMLANAVTSSAPRAPTSYVETTRA